MIKNKERLESGYYASQILKSSYKSQYPVEKDYPKIPDLETILNNVEVIFNAPIFPVQDGKN